MSFLIFELTHKLHVAPRDECGEHSPLSLEVRNDVYYLSIPTPDEE